MRAGHGVEVVGEVLQGGAPVVLPFKREQIAKDPVVVGRTRPKLLVHKFSQSGDRIRVAREQNFAVRMPQGATHDGAGQFQRLRTRGGEDCQARKSVEARRGDRLAVQAQAVPKLFPSLRGFLSLDLIQERWHSPSRPVGIDYLCPVRHQGIQPFQSPWGPTCRTTEPRSSSAVTGWGSPGWRYCPRMHQLPCTLEALVVRTDFSADGAWDALRTALYSPSGDGFLANVALVDGRRYEGLTPEEALDLLPAGYQHPLVVLADSVAFASAELPLLVVGLRGERGRCVRVVAAKLWSIENNLSEANMDFEEFVDAVGDDGFFRGF